MLLAVLEPVPVLVVCVAVWLPPLLGGFPFEFVVGGTTRPVAWVGGLCTTAVVFAAATALVVLRFVRG